MNWRSYFLDGGCHEELSLWGMPGWERRHLAGPAPLPARRRRSQASHSHAPVAPDRGMGNSSENGRRTRHLWVPAACRRDAGAPSRRSSSSSVADPAGAWETHTEMNPGTAGMHTVANLHPPWRTRRVMIAQKGTLIVKICVICG